MSVDSVGFVPCAPLLIPEVAGGPAGLDDKLRSAARSAVRRMIETEPSLIVVVAPTPTSVERLGSSVWDFAGFGVPRVDPPVGERLPWQLGIGAWLLDDGGWEGRRRYLGVDVGAVGNISEDGRVAVLAVGDGSACRTEKAPGYLNPRAAAFDAAIASCFATGDVAGLAAIDADLGEELLCCGLPVWRWLATTLDGLTVTSATVSYDAAPYGVGYFVASWLLA